MIKKLTNYTDIDTTKLTLTLMREGRAEKIYPISTASKGVGNKENSLQTPLGIHTICEKIGHNEPLGRQFISRLPTDTLWQTGDPHSENLILTRIIRLQGEEQGVNKGQSIDSFERYIYIHGTNQEDALGIKAVSHGCILMSNKDIVSYFNNINEGEYVSIHQ